MSLKEKIQVARQNFRFPGFHPHHRHRSVTEAAFFITLEAELQELLAQHTGCRAADGWTVVVRNGYSRDILNSNMYLC